MRHTQIRKKMMPAKNMSRMNTRKVMLDEVDAEPIEFKSGICAEVNAITPHQIA